MLKLAQHQSPNGFHLLDVAKVIGGASGQRKVDHDKVHQGQHHQSTLQEHLHVRVRREVNTAVRPGEEETRADMQKEGGKSGSLPRSPKLRLGQRGHELTALGELGDFQEVLAKTLCLGARGRARPLGVG